MGEAGPPTPGRAGIGASRPRLAAPWPRWARARFDLRSESHIRGVPRCAKAVWPRPWDSEKDGPPGSLRGVQAGDDSASDEADRESRALKPVLPDCRLGAGPNGGPVAESAACLEPWEIPPSDTYAPFRGDWTRQCAPGQCSPRRRRVGARRALRVRGSRLAQPGRRRRSLQVSSPADSDPISRRQATESANRLRRGPAGQTGGNGGPGSQL